MVGWYTTTSPVTGEFINDNSSLIHDVFAKEVENPVHLVVDTTLLRDTINIRGFIGKSSMVGGEILANSFHEIKVDIDFNDVESTLLYHMIANQGEEKEKQEEKKSTENQKKDMDEKKWKDANIISTIPSHQKNVENALNKFSVLLDQVQSFVDNVVNNSNSGSVPSSYREIGIALTDLLNNYASASSSLSSSGSSSSSSSDLLLLNNKFEDLLMVSYLSTLTETQTFIAEKLNQVL
jgi:translation initiation factor 3 subunit F